MLSPLAAICLAVTLSVVAYLAMCAYVYLNQSKYMFVPEREIEATPADVGLAFESIVLDTPDKERLSAWFVPATAGPAAGWTLLYCHGNAGNIGDRVEPVRLLHEIGMSVLIFDYRGFGNSTGSPSETGTYTDARAAWRYLVETRGVSPSRIVVYGHSLGAAIAAWLAEQVRPAALVLDAPFTSAIDIGSAKFPHLPIRRLSRYRYDTINRIASITSPLLVVHGKSDTTVPIVHGKRVFARALPPKRFVEFVGDHATGGMDPQTGYRAVLLEWLKELEAQTPVGNAAHHEEPGPPEGGTTNGRS